MPSELITFSPRTLQTSLFPDFTEKETEGRELEEVKEGKVEEEKKDREVEEGAEGEGEGEGEERQYLE